MGLDSGNVDPRRHEAKGTPNLFNNGTNLKFADISSEDYREYRFPNGDFVRIERPVMLNVSKNGHRVWDEMEVSHYIPHGWIHLSWKVKKGEPNFIK